LTNRNFLTFAMIIKTKINLLILILLFVTATCNSQNTQNQKVQTKSTDRQAVVSGQFYPSNADELKSMLKQLFSSALPNQGIKKVLAIISPHAGYVFSGEVAATSFSQIDVTKNYENIFILGPSHYVSLQGASIYSKGNYITPLGKVKVNTELAEKLIKEYSFFSFNKAAHLYEHSIEVQLPFLQYIMQKDYQIVPVVIGSQDQETLKKIAHALSPYFNSKNLFIISTDFSHYPGYDDAKIVDKRTVNAIKTNSSEALLNTLQSNAERNTPNLVTSLCGRAAVLTLLYMTENEPDILITPVQYKNSGDTKYGDKNKVVGYNSIIFSFNKKKTMKNNEFNLTKKDKKDLLYIARFTIEQYINNNKIPEIDAANFSKTLMTNCGAFVTLHKNGALRGCIGRFDASEPIYKVIQEMAISSSTQDYRFNRVTSKEVSELEIEISVLTPMKKIKSVDEIQLGKHGIYIKKGFASGTFLPQVADETHWTKEEFLGHCARDKAGIGWDGWKDADIYTYEAIVFSEKDFK